MTGYPSPIVVVGMLQRSGTNFLSDLLRQHPCCTAPGVLGEDFLLANAQHLGDYVAAVLNCWNPKWNADGKIGKLEEILGQVPSRFLHQIADDPRKRVVTHTPSCANLERFFTAFPSGHLLIIVRDGPALIESGMRSFGWRFEDAARQWQQAAQRVLDFTRQFGARGERHALVRFEDLLQNQDEVLRRIFALTHLPADVYDFDATRHLPMRGSSELSARGGLGSAGAGAGAGVHWAPQSKRPGFDPTQRARHWSAAQRRRFDWICGAEARELGYAPAFDGSNTVYWTARNNLADAREWLRRAARRVHRLALAAAGAGAARRANGAALSHPSASSIPSAPSTLSTSSASSTPSTSNTPNASSTTS